MGELRARPAHLRTAAGAWDEQRDELDVALKALASIDTKLLGDRVSTHAKAFVTSWSTEVGRLSQLAGEHAQALRDSADLLALADSRTARTMTSLHPPPDTPAGGDR